MINTKFDNHVNNIENKESNGERERERGVQFTLYVTICDVISLYFFLLDHYF